MKSNLSYVICAGLGLLNFILLAFPYIAAFSKMDGYDFGNYSTGFSGYKVLDLWGMGFSGAMSALMQLFILLLGIALLGWGVLGLLKAFGIFEKFPDKLGNVSCKKIGEIGLIALAGLNVLLLIFLIILTATNTESGEGWKSGVRLSAGIFISIIFTVGAVVALKLLEKKFPATDSGESVTYVCVKCGKKAKSSDKFCNNCGGEIEKRVAVKEEYVCEKCGKTATAKDKFCNNCGGAIVKKVEQPQEAPPAAQEVGSVDDVVPKE